MKNKTLLTLIIYSIAINLAFATSCVLLALCGRKQPYIAIFITLFMFAYHADIRHLISAITTLFKSKINIDCKIFSVSEREFIFLNKLKVKKWKDKFVTLYKDQFKINQNIDIVLKNNIHAEICHWICFFAGLFAILFGYLLSANELWIYIITSILASFLLDLPPILIQRFNRFRLQKIKNWRNK